MIQLRKTRKRHKCSIYSNEAVIRIAKGTQCNFIVSKLIIEMLKINPTKDGIMFGFKDKKLHIWKEPKDDDNYHLCKNDTNTFRFRSIELFEHLTAFYNVEKGATFVIKMDKDFVFTLKK